MNKWPRHGPRCQAQSEWGLGYLHFLCKSSVQVPKEIGIHGTTVAIGLHGNLVMRGVRQSSVEAYRQGKLCCAAAQEHGTSDKRAGWNSSPVWSSVHQGCQEFHHPHHHQNFKGINRERINGKGWTSSHDGPGAYRLRLRGRPDR